MPVHARDTERAAIDGHHLPLDAAVMPEHREDRIAAREIRVGVVRAPDRQWTRGLAQHEQTGRVIDLPIDQHDAGNAGVARRARRLQHRIRLQLRQDIGRGVDERPLALVATTHGNRGLGSSLSPQGAVTDARTVTAVAIPLRKAAAGGRPQHPNFHKASTFARRAGPVRPRHPEDVLAPGNVHRDFHAKAELSRRRNFPAHIALLRLRPKNHTTSKSDPQRPKGLCDICSAAVTALALGVTSKARSGLETP